MKLPAKDDPGGDKEGELPRYIVLQTLRENVVNVEILNDVYLLSKGDEITAQVFREYIGGLMIRRLSNFFGISLLDFYYDRETGCRKDRKQIH